MYVSKLEFRNSYNEYRHFVSCAQVDFVGDKEGGGTVDILHVNCNDTKDVPVAPALYVGSISDIFLLLLSLFA